MKTLAVIFVLCAGVLSGCIAVPVDDGRGHNQGYNQGQYRGDRDGDGVPNRQDRRPDDPRRY